MPVPVMSIRKMNVKVRQGKMGMPVAVGWTLWTGVFVGVLMVGPMRMVVFMIHLFVRMVMFMTLGQVQPDPRP
jgi:hypothetical protein